MIKLGWVARLQFAPALLAMSLTSVIVILIITLLLGRLYCSTVCPMGIMLDVAAATHPRRQYHYSPPRNKVRLTVLLLTVAATAAGSSLILALFEPYGSFSRIATWLLRPLIDSGQLDVALGAALPATLLALITFIGVAIWARARGRAYCNTICPVGTLLGIAAKNSLMHIDIDTDRCINCRRCEHVCKSSCIDLNDHVADMSRCVVCFNCIDVCPNDAIHYTHKRHRLSIPLMMKVSGTSPAATASAPATGTPVPDAPVTASPIAGRADSRVSLSSPEDMTADADDGKDNMADVAETVKISRRRFLTVSALAAALPAVNAVEKRVPGTHRTATPARPVPPPGIRSVDSLLRKCVGCGRCISACPAKVLRPSVSEYGLLHPLVPMMDYDSSYCIFECNDCTHVCPTGALSPMTLQEKQNTAIGLASVDPDLCVGCGRCAANCPKETITMTTLPGHKRRTAIVDHSSCIGCGACQNVCPVDPKAIVVNGLRR